MIRRMGNQGNRDEEGMLHSYLDKVNDSYINGDRVTQRIIYNTIEGLVDNIKVAGLKNRSTPEVYYDGIRARQIRESLGMTPAELARKIGINNSVISRFESGKTKKTENKKYVTWLRDQDK